MFKGELYPFQAEAVERMIEAKKLLVAYEMGLGKTVIAIAATERLIEAGEAGGSLIICPASIKHQWLHMLEEFAPDARAILVNGDRVQRDRQYRDYKGGHAEYLIINPEQLVNDWEIVSKLPRDVIIADEAQWFKNFKPRRSKKMKRLKAEYQWALTGQPIENRAEEAFSIFQWVQPTVLGDFQTFDRAFIVRDHWGRVKLYKNLPTLHRLLGDHMVRRTRAEVADQLPAVTEQSILVDFDEPGRNCYNRILVDLENDILDAVNTWGNFSLSSLYRGEEGQAQGAIMSKLVCMRMLCDHPELLRQSAANFVDEHSKLGSEYAAELQQKGRLDKLILHPKLVTLVSLLEDILGADPANKVVVFAYFKGALKLIADTTKDLTKSVFFTGDVKLKDRDAAKQQFANDPGTRLFLSSDAGGVGLDLPMANYLISFDLPWSAGVYSQRQSRIIRLSSVWPRITLISIRMTDSIEEYQFQLLGQKKRVADAVIDGRGISPKGRLTLDLQSLSAFLRTHRV